MNDRLIAPTTVHMETASPRYRVKQSSTEFRFSPQNAGEAVRGRAWQGFAARMKSIPRIFNAALREIFDESAYARFLNQRQLASSRAAYAAFRQEHEVAKARRPKCC